MENSIVKPEEKILDFDNNKVEILTFEELGHTSLERFGGNELNGIRHYDFITKILEIVTKLGFIHKTEKVYAANNKAKLFQGVSVIPELEETHGKNSIRAHILRRILTRIVISDHEDNISNTAIAISYHQNGIEVAMGPNIKVCSNQCIMGSGRHLRTYGNERIPGHENMLEIIGEWLYTFREKRIEDQKLLEKMMNYDVDYPTMSKMVGELSLMRVGKDDLKMSVDYPLSQGQINRISRSYLEDVKTKKDNKESDIISLYDVYNYGTAELKPDQMEIPNVLLQNAAFGDYIIDLIKD
jgi:hypothetical protein